MDGLGKLTLISQGGRQIGVRIYQHRFEAHCLPIMLDCLLGPALPPQDIPEVIVRLRVLRPPA